MDRDGEQKRVEDKTRIFLRPLASPLPLGFFAFGVGIFLQSCLQLGPIPQSETRNLAIILAAFVFPAQAIAAIFAFLSRETLGATVLSLLAFNWLASALVMASAAPAPTSSALGLLYLCLTAVLVLIGTSAFLGKPLLAAVIALASVRFALTGIYELTASVGVQLASGVLGCVIALASLYGGIAFGIEDIQHRTVLPIGRRGEARRALEGDVGEQIGPVETEAGVRKQL